MGHATIVPFASAVVLAAISMDAYGQEADQVPKYAMLATISETALISAGLFQDQGNGKTEHLDFFAHYSTTEWDLVLKGSVDNRSVYTTVTGFRWGGENTDWLITYSGQGQFRDQNVRVYGRATWIYDSDSKDYHNLDVQQAVKFGDHSIWNYVKGSEIIFGGTVAAGAAIIAAPVSGGATAVIGLAAAVLGANGMCVLSENAKAVFTSDQPQSPPTPPARPIVPTPNISTPLAKISDNASVISFLQQKGAVFGIGPNKNLQLDGNYDETTYTGQIELK